MRQGDVGRTKERKDEGGWRREERKREIGKKEGRKEGRSEGRAGGRKKENISFNLK